MINIRMISIINDGQIRRVSATYDLIDNDGKLIKTNAKVNRIVTEQGPLKEIEDVEDFCKSIIEE